MKIFLTSIFAQTFLTGYVLYHVWHALPPKKTWRIPAAALIIVEVLLFFCGYFFHKHLNDGFLYFLQIVCGTWFIASIYFSMFLLLLDGLRFLQGLFHWFPGWIIRNYRQVKLALFFIILGMVAFFLDCGYRNYRHPKVKEQPIEISKKAGRMESVRIAFAADIHAGYIVDRVQLKKYVDFINAQQCDLVMLGGDMIDYDLHPLEKQDMSSEFRRLQAPLGVYAVLGNHEYRFNTEKKIEWLRQAGITVLRDSVAMPGLSFYLIGRDDFKNPERKTLAYLLTGLDTSRPVIVADHQPFNIGESIMNQVDLLMMGHVHNGQIWPYNYVMDWYWDGFAEGYARRGNTQMYVSSGLGLSGPPFRVFTDSEVVVFEIHFRK